MRMMAETTPEDELERNPKWNRLVTLHASLKKLLPEGYRWVHLECVAVRN